MFFILFLACLFSTQHLYSAAAAADAAADTVTYYAVNHPDNAEPWKGWRPVRSYYSLKRTEFGELEKRHVFTLWINLKDGHQSLSLWNDADGNPKEYVTFESESRTGPEIYRANGYCARLFTQCRHFRKKSGFGPLSKRLQRNNEMKKIEDYKKWASKKARTEKEHCLYIFGDSEKNPVFTSRAPNPFLADYLHQQALKMQALEKKHTDSGSSTTQRRSTAV